MKKHLQKQLKALITAQWHLRRALTRFHYPTMHEDIDYLIRDTQDLLAALDRGETVPH